MNFHSLLLHNFTNNNNSSNTMFQSDPKNRSTASKSTIQTSSSKHVECDRDFVSPCHSPRKDSHFKENFDVNKSGTTKLSMEPLQMKRKKKGGGCNLRKSLAWDRAFFTEEGVLDPLELSIISGGSRGEELPSINEDTPNSSLKSEPRNNIRKDFSDEDLCKGRRKPCLSPKLGQSSSNTTTLQKTKARFGNKSESSSSVFHRPLSSSSLKRPATVNNGKTVVKEMKLQNVPSSKTGSTPVQTSKSNIPRPRCVNPSQIAQPAFSIRTHGVLKSSSKSRKTIQTDTTSAFLGALCRHPEKYSSNSSFNGHQSINTSRTLAAKADEDSYSNNITANTIPSHPGHSSGDPYKRTSHASSFSRHPHDNGPNMQTSQNLITKPSCLRMPSPSLSFFSQPKASVKHDLSPTGTCSGICGSLKPGDLRLQDTLRTTLKENIFYSTTSSCSSSTNSSRPHFLVPPHVNDASRETVKSTLERNFTPMVEMNVLCDTLNSVEYHVFGRQILHHSKKNGTERYPPPEQEAQMINNEMLSQDVSHERVVDQSCDRRDPELISEHNSERGNSVSEPRIEPSTSINDVITPDASIDSNCGNAIDHVGQDSLSMQQITRQSNFHVPCIENADQLCSHVAINNTSDDGNVLKKNETATELLCGSQQSVTLYIGSKYSYVESGHQHDFLTDETICGETVTKKILRNEVNVQDAEHSSTKEGCGNYLHLISDVSGDIKLLGTVSEVQTVCHEVDNESQKNDETNRLSPVAIDYRWHDENDLRNHEPKAVLSHNLSNEKLSDHLYQTTQKVEIDDCNSFLAIRTNEVSLTDVVPVVEDNGGNHKRNSTIPLKEEATDMDEQGEARGNCLVQSPSLNEHCANQSDSVEWLNAGRVAETLSHNYDGFCLESLFRKSIDKSCEDNILGSLVDSLEIGEGALRKSFGYKQESPLEHESCVVTDQNDYHSSNFDEERADSSRINPLIDPSKVEGSEDVSDSHSTKGIQTESNPLQSKVELELNENHVDGLNVKRQMLLILQNAVPFSDEWLAAIEAAGEDILTKKGGAVQNSPTEKTLPEPSPWSPVKKKNNQIGPFSCTKYTNTMPSGSK